MASLSDLLFRVQTTLEAIPALELKLYTGSFDLREAPRQALKSSFTVTCPSSINTGQQRTRGRIREQSRLVVTLGRQVNPKDLFTAEREEETRVKAVRDAVMTQTAFPEYAVNYVERRAIYADARDYLFTVITFDAAYTMELGT